MNTNRTPRETDTELAELHTELGRAQQRVGYNNSAFLSAAGARYYYRGKRRVTDMKVADAIAAVTAEVERMHAHEVAHADQDGVWIGWTGPLAPHALSNAERAIADRPALLAEVARIANAIDALEATYTGWSRFFLVTSSAGHVHSSTCCSTCRPTTTYGWLPSLSGKDEATAVKELGPTLCSVCFPSAPVEWTTGKKITAAQAAKKAA